MRVIKCDMCNKELKDFEVCIRSNEMQRLDLCEQCEEVYEQCDSEITQKRRELRTKYEEEIEKETEKIFKKYKINLGGNHEKESV